MNKRWRATRLDVEKAQKKRYLEKNRKKIREYHRKWKKANADKMRKWHREHAREKRATDPQYVIRARVMSRIRSALIKGHKSASSQVLLGCSIAEYKTYIESLFVDGMTWEALLKGEIHLDHKIPCCSFDLTDPAQQRECFHYLNTQPLWAEDNHQKVAEDLKIRDQKRLDKANDSSVSSDNTNP
jgi:Prasinovirus endonuclease VII